MTIKKAYESIITFLEANQDKKVKAILDEVRELASAKTNRAGGSNYIKDSTGNVVAILDYYFKRWMPLVGEAAVEFGAKKNTPTGFNTMCKKGVSEWTKQQSEAKKANAQLLTRVAAGEIQPSDIPAEQAAIEQARGNIVETELGFASKEEVLAYLASSGIDVTNVDQADAE